MLRPSRRNPKMSAYMALEGAFDYNKTTLAPPGTKVVIHKNPDKRSSWEAHGVDGWYIGPVLEHHRCYCVYVTNTGAERNSDTVEFFLQHTKVPSIATNDAATTAAQEPVAALSNPKPNTLWEKVGNQQLSALHSLKQSFQDTTARKKLGYETSKHPEK